MVRVLIYGCGKTGNSIKEQIEKKHNISTIRKNTPNKRELLENSELVILTLSKDMKTFHVGMNKGQYTARVLEFERNKPHIDDFLSEISGLKIPIITVTNPVDIVTRYIKEKLRYDHVYAFGLDLDKVRFSIFLGRDVNVVGYHGMALPILGLHKKEVYLEIIKEVGNKALESYIHNGIDYSFVGKTFAKFFENFVSGKIETKAPKLNDIERDLLQEFNERFEIDYKSLAFNSPT